MTYHYTIEVYKIGALLAKIPTTGTDALTAIANAEKVVKAKRQRCQLQEGQQVRTVLWSGLEFVARRGAVA